MNPVAEKLYGAQLFDLMDHTCAHYPILDAEHALTRMLVALKDCTATTDLGFRKWANAFIRTMADDIVRDQVTSFDEVIKIAQERDTEPKPPFISEQHPAQPEITFVKIERGRGGRDSSIWIVPTDKLPLVQILHPTVAVRFMRIGNLRYPYLIKKCQRQLYSGAWDTVERDLGAIWMGIDEHFQSYEARDGNYLNYLPHNLHVYKLSRLDALNFAAQPIWDEKDTSDWKPDASTAVPFNEDNRELSYDRPTSQPMSKHELEVHKVLHGDVALRTVATEEGRLLQKAEEHDEEVFSVDVAVQKLQKGWGIEP
ncbi:MAG TPA: hypothetical protein VN950_01240 [Terriglobales bacterium]|nr:hypothetical protein [Terriglobales bacterium]